ncbi:glutathione S-transferase [Paralcaligenes sp. KSB-10]|uniref:glutathione S-transferase n=1 Tax=Paralcaligenes sp. KSB-10 TaxID=2901142 RepID=UPI001E312D32|nr:glutathione S-transferase [Paralcaligenes sp. KSB-10]UHL62718.1 glutathione S-transferase [Paralcaligenes sp. KSB-10]
MPGLPLPILYSFRRCPYAMRARLAIAASGQACELREVALRDKPQAMLDVSPKATVPVLITGNSQVLEQSLDIMLWALAQNDPHEWLAPTQPGMDAMLELIAECDGPFKHHLDRYKYPQRHADSQGSGHHRDEAAFWLSRLDARLQRQPFLFGAHAALADMAIAPFVRQFAHVDREWFQAMPWPGLQAWLQAWQESELMALIMEKHAPWAPGAAGVRFPA